ncbi:MAG: hypothetical protein AB9879_09235 [Methanothrix sp.]
MITNRGVGEPGSFEVASCPLCGFRAVAHARRGLGPLVARTSVGLCRRDAAWAACHLQEIRSSVNHR